MIGAIIGDIVGSRFEFNNHRSKEFELFTSECSYTDDTICTIAVADAILSNQSFETSLLHWCQKYPYPTGSYGLRFSQWINNADRKPYNSFGNGSAMRVSPCAYIFRKKSLQEVLFQAEQSALCTHNHPEGIRGARNVAELIWYALNGLNLHEIKKAALNMYSNIRSMTLSSLVVSNIFDETCQVTVPQAILCVLESTSFEDAIRNAVSIGGDTDTIACIAGGMAEALWGIPQQIKAQAMSYLPNEMIRVLEAEYAEA